MVVHVCPDADALARACATYLETRIRAACDERGKAVVAFSGGSTPEPMLAELPRGLAGRELPWEHVHVVQVDERVAPDGHPDRNWTMIQRALIEPAGLPEENAHPMPVTDPDLKVAAVRYGALLRDLCGEPVVLDVVHLGLGPDGHAASLIPGDAALDEQELNVTLAGPYQGRVRMTLTFPAINRARSILWQISGADKAKPLRAMLDGADIPASRVRRDGDVAVYADREAAGA
jgi:6-phosphogluconolactonase